MPNELGDFLRARRADASPDLPISSPLSKRRVAGLRREEVSAAAGISVDYYTRLEQGREAHPSDAVLNGLARALCLAPDALEHLYRLRGVSPPLTSYTSVNDGFLGERRTTLVAAVRPNPAYILNRLSDMVAVNPEGLALYEGLADCPPRERNTCRYLLADARAKHIFVEWEEVARGAVAHLRAANADNLQDPLLQTLVAELCSKSAQFDHWWGGHIVERRRTSIKHIRTKGAKIVARRYEVLHLPEDRLRMTIWMDATPPMTSIAGPVLGR